MIEDDLFGEGAFTASSVTTVAAPLVQNTLKTDTVPVNFETVLDRFDGDQDFMREMFQEYKGQLSERVFEIRAAAQDGDAPRLARLAHNLKGVSLNFSADSLSHVALALETMSKDNNLTNVLGLIEQLECEASRVTDYLSDSGY
jgi:HPt (histidine-containing phosphotransfer) domain-containing protein